MAEIPCLTASKNENTNVNIIANSIKDLLKMVHIQKQQQKVLKGSTVLQLSKQNTVSITIVMSPLVYVTASGLTYFIIERMYHFIPPTPSLTVEFFLSVKLSIPLQVVDISPEARK